MLKTEKKEINGRIYNVTQFTASEGLPIKADLHKLKEGNVTEVLRLLSKTTRDDEAINKNTFDKFYTDEYQELEDVVEFVAVFNFLPKRDTGNLTSKPKRKQKASPQDD